MHPAMKAALMKVHGYAKKMKGDAMKSRVGAKTPGVDNTEESTEVEPMMGEAVPSEEKAPPKEAPKDEKAHVLKLLGMHKRK
jgi:hypothetical protein